MNTIFNNKGVRPSVHVPPGHFRQKNNDRLHGLSSDLQPCNLDTKLNQSIPNGELDVPVEKVRQTQQAQTYCESLLGMPG